MLLPSGLTGQDFNKLQSLANDLKKIGAEGLYLKYKTSVCEVFTHTQVNLKKFLNHKEELLEIVDIYPSIMHYKDHEKKMVLTILDRECKSYYLCSETYTFVEAPAGSILEEVYQSRFHLGK